MVSGDEPFGLSSRVDVDAATANGPVASPQASCFAAG